MAAGENLLTGNPTMTTLYATGEPALIGAIAATASQNRDKLKIFGWDLSAQAIAAIDAGTVVGVVQQAPDQDGADIATRAGDRDLLAHDATLFLAMLSTDSKGTISPLTTAQT